MPIKGQSPKEVVHTELHKFKHGSLHSGSKSGPLVKSRKQAIAIALSESGQSNKKAHGGKVATALRTAKKYARGGEIAKERQPTGEIPSIMTPETTFNDRWASRAAPAYNNQGFNRKKMGYADGGLARSYNRGSIPNKANKPDLDPDVTISLMNEGKDFTRPIYGDVGGFKVPLGREGADMGMIRNPNSSKEFPWGDQSFNTLHAGQSFAKGGETPYKCMASGGGMGNFNPERASAIGLAHQGAINSPVPGRTDKLNLNVASGSSIVPADVVSGLGQGNTDAGHGILTKMFTKGPYGMNLPKTKAGSRVGNRKASLSKMKMHFADGGEAGQTTPIVAAGGEHVLTPDQVANVGNGDLDLGHSILNAFYEHIRAKTIKQMKGLKPPKNG